MHTQYLCCNQVLYGDVLAAKDDPQIIFRGKAESLQAQIILQQAVQLLWPACTADLTVHTQYLCCNQARSLPLQDNTSSGREDDPKAVPLTPKRELSQPGQFLSEQRVTLVGPKGRKENVSVFP